MHNPWSPRPLKTTKLTYIILSPRNPPPDLLLVWDDSLCDGSWVLWDCIWGLWDCSWGLWDGSWGLGGGLGGVAGEADRELPAAGVDCCNILPVRLKTKSDVPLTEEPLWLRLNMTKTVPHLITRDCIMCSIYVYVLLSMSKWLNFFLTYRCGKWMERWHF